MSIGAIVLWSQFSLEGPLGRPVVQSLSCVWPFVTPWDEARQSSLSFTISWILFKLMSIELMIPSNHLILCRPILLLSSVYLSIRVFSNESVLHIRWPKYWSFSFSISPSNKHLELISFRIDWFELLGSSNSQQFELSRVWDSQESYPPQFKSINSSALSLLYNSALQSIHDYWRNHIFDYTNLCQQSDISAF